MKIAEKQLKIIVEVARILLGCLFVFSGFVKAVDPLGSAYKFQDYFTAFGFNSLEALTLPMSFGLSAIEFALGVCLLLAVYRKPVTVLTLLFMLFMTGLTLYSAITNPVTDCGCFGDALVLSNWNTFYKNIVLLLFAVIVFRWSRLMTAFFSSKSALFVVLYTCFFILTLSFYCYKNLPILDFRPYKTGANIPQMMTIPEGAPQDEYLMTFIYEKDGVQKEFTLENYPANDSTWKFVDSKSKLLKKGYQPLIHDFSITDERGDDITEEVLSDTSYTFLLIAHKLQKASDQNVDMITEVYDFSVYYKYRFYMLTASTADEIQAWRAKTGAKYAICTMDDITLKTIIRSNPGLLLLKQGVVVNKWADRNLPSGAILEKPIAETALGKTAIKHDFRTIVVCACILILPIALFFVFDAVSSKRERRKSAEKHKIE